MQINLVVIVLVVASAYASSSAASVFVGDVLVPLRHVDAGKQLSNAELIHRAMQRSKARVAALSVARNGGGGGRFSGESDHQQPQPRPRAMPVRPSGDMEYVVDLALGTPPRHIFGLLDTGSDLIWTQCAPCSECLPQPDPLFAPRGSASFKPARCSSQLCSDIRHGCQKPDTCIYQYSYGDGTTTVGVMATERFTFTSPSGEKLSVPLGFGCGFQNWGSLNNASGIVGFGRDRLSLLSQLSIPRFSYCLTPYDSTRRSTVLFGSLNNGVYGDATMGSVQTTLLLQSPQNPTFYYVHFTGLTVGTTRLRIPESAFALKPDGSGGVLVDSGTAVTLFPSAVLDEAVQAFRMQLRLPLANSSDSSMGVCFQVPPAHRRTPSQVPVPRLVFHFQGANLDLPRRNYVYDDESGGQLCILLVDSGDEGSTIGNIAQQDMRVLYDLKADTLSFAPAQC